MLDQIKALLDTDTMSIIQKSILTLMVAVSAFLIIRPPEKVESFEQPYEILTRIQTGASVPVHVRGHEWISSNDWIGWEWLFIELVVLNGVGLVLIRVFKEKERPSLQQ